ncbi:solute carrier family 23 protein [Bacillus paralicheniformis]|uniref:solute carrier family 23 protein n=1 Tax=Bacillus paralicheniformis TaxID=1648923 RepID=UPI003BF9A05B
MYAGAVIVPLIVSSQLGFTQEQTTYLVAIDLLMCGIATLLQVFTNCFFGIGMPVVLGWLENVDPPALIGSFIGAVMMGVCWARLGLGFGLIELLMLLVMLAGSVMVYFGVYAALTSLSLPGARPP